MMAMNHRKINKTYTTSRDPSHLDNPMKELDIKDIINNLKQYRQGPKKNIKRPIDQRNNRSISIPKCNPNAKKLYSPNRSFVDSTKGKRNLNPVEVKLSKANQNPSSGVLCAPISKDTSGRTSSNPRRINKDCIGNKKYGFITQSFGFGGIRVNESINCNKGKKYKEESSAGKDYKGNMMTYSLHDYIQTKDITKSSDNSIGTHAKVKSEFSSVQGYSTNFTLPVLAQIDKLLENHDGLSVEDMHFCFVSFYQRKKELLKEIEKVPEDTEIIVDFSNS